MYLDSVGFLEVSGPDSCQSQVVEPLSDVSIVFGLVFFILPGLEINLPLVLQIAKEEPFLLQCLVADVEQTHDSNSPVAKGQSGFVAPDGVLHNNCCTMSWSTINRLSDLHLFDRLWKPSLIALSFQSLLNVSEP